MAGDKADRRSPSDELSAAEGMVCGLRTLAERRI